MLNFTAKRSGMPRNPGTLLVKSKELGDRLSLGTQKTRRSDTQPIKVSMRQLDGRSQGKKLSTPIMLVG